jgi:predicted dehydrogenase
MNQPGLRTAVIGAGYLGRFHAQKYATLPDSELVGIADVSADARARLAEELRVPATADYRELLGRVDAVSIAAPTPLHFEIARAFLESGAHVLVEKPITTTVTDARTLIDIAARRERVLQVGHLERFNPGILALERVLKVPRFVESHRLAPFRQRGTDVSVVLDLMIHDIDIIQNIVHAPIRSLDAIGASVFSNDLDIVNARIRFANGCVVNTTASRVSLKTERKLRIFQDDAYMSVDLQQKILTVVRKSDDPPGGELPPVRIEEQSFEQGDALRTEIESFLECVRTGRQPIVSGEDGLSALETALRISEQVTGGRSGG